MQAFETQPMANGSVALILQPNITWGQFPELAMRWAKKLQAAILAEPIITNDECLLEIAIDGLRFLITYDDFQSSLCLEPKEKDTDETVFRIQKKLIESR